MRPRNLAVSIAVVASISGCKPQEQTDLPICLAEVAGSEAEEVQTGEVPADVWFSILLRNYNRKTSQVARPVRDCSGSEVGTTGDETMDACLQGEDPVTELPERPLTQEDLVIVPTDDGTSIVWVQTRHFDDGDAVGPIALAQWTQRGVAVRAIGTLRAKTDRASLRLERMGQERVLVVESQVCDPDDPKKCNRVMRVVPLSGDRFVERPLVLEDGTCLGPAELELYREKQVELDGKIRTFEMGRTVDFTDGNVVVSEQVQIEDMDPEQPDAPPQVFRKANVQRPLQLGPKGIVTKPGLWDKMVSEHGSVAVEAEAGAEE